VNATILDTITTAFVGALQAGSGAIQAYALPLLGVFAVLACYLHLGPLLMSGAVLGDALGSLVLSVLKIGVFYWLLVHLAPLASAAFLTFFQWGLAPAGGGFSQASFVHPSVLIDLGFRVALPLQELMGKFTGWASLWNFYLLAFYMVAYWGIVLAFTFVALHLMVTIIEYHLAVMVGAVLIPWGVLQPTAFLTEFSIGWLTGGLVRILVTAAIVGIAVPLFQLITLHTTGGGDPTLYSAIVVALTSGVFGILSWVIPGRAAAIAGRGVSLALHGGTILAGAASGARGVLVVNAAATAAARGVSSLLRRR